LAWDYSETSDVSFKVKVRGEGRVIRVQRTGNLVSVTQDSQIKTHPPS